MSATNEILQWAVDQGMDLQPKYASMWAKASELAAPFGIAILPTIKKLYSINMLQPQNPPIGYVIQNVRAAQVATGTENDAAATRRSHPARPYPAYLKTFTTPKWFRDQALARYPALSHPKNGERYRKLFAYFRDGRFLDRDTGEVIASAEIVARCWGTKADNGGYGLKNALEDFSRDVFKIEFKRHSSVQRKATTAAVHWSEQDKEDYARLMGADTGDGRDWRKVDFVTGVRETSGRRKANREHNIATANAMIPSDHPASRLIKYLNDSSLKIEKLIRKNLPEVEQAILALPDGPQKTWSEGVHSRLCMGCQMTYRATERSARIYAIGTTIHQLPRDIRAVALHGGVEFDLKACQMAIISVLWEIPTLEKRMADSLTSGGSIWTDLLTEMGLQSDDKNLLKRAIYSVIFGMRETNVRKLLREGRLTPTDADVDGEDEATQRWISEWAGRGLGESATNRVMKNAVMQSLLEARNRKIEDLKIRRSVEDAFCRTLRIADQDGSEGKAICSILAQVVQSHEMKIMQSLLDIIASDDRIYIISWLHDGVTLYFSDKKEQRGRINTITRKMNERIVDMGFPTKLEVKELTEKKRTALSDENEDEE